MPMHNIATGRFSALHLVQRRTQLTIGGLTFAFLLALGASPATAQPRITCDEVRRVRAAAVAQGMQDRTLATLESQTCGRVGNRNRGDRGRGKHDRRDDVGRDDRGRGGRNAGRNGGRSHGRNHGNHGPPPQVQSEECGELRTLRSLARAAGSLAQVQDDIQALSLLMCEFGGTTHASYRSGKRAQFSYGWDWPNGKTAKRSYGWDWPNGKTAIRSYGYDWPNGKTAKRSYGWDYPNGKTAYRSYGWSLPGGQRSGTERDALVWACQQVDRKTCSRRMNRIEGRTGDARKAAVVSFLWRAHRRR